MNPQREVNNKLFTSYRSPSFRLLLLLNSYTVCAKLTNGLSVSLHYPLSPLEPSYQYKTGALYFQWRGKNPTQMFTHGAVSYMTIQSLNNSFQKDLLPSSPPAQMCLVGLMFLKIGFSLQASNGTRDTFNIWRTLEKAPETVWLPTSSSSLLVLVKLFRSGLTNRLPRSLTISRK